MSMFSCFSQRIRPLTSFLVVSAALVTVPFVHVQSSAAAEFSARQPKKPLGHDSYEEWSQITTRLLSNDGKWTLYGTRSNKGVSVTRLLEIKTGQQYLLKKTRLHTFSYDGKWLIYLQGVPKTATSTKPKTGSSTKGTKQSTKTVPLKSVLVIMNLATGNRTYLDGAQQYAMPQKSSEWIAYHISAAPVRFEPSHKTKIREVELNRLKGVEIDSQLPHSKKDAPTSKPKVAPKPNLFQGKVIPTGKTVAIRNLKTGIEIRYPNIDWFTFSKTGKQIAWYSSNKDPKKRGLFLLNTANYQWKRIAAENIKVAKLVFSESEKSIAFIGAVLQEEKGIPKRSKSTTKKKSTKEKRVLAAYHWKVGQKLATVVTTPGKNGFDKNWEISSTICRFSEDASRIFISVKERPAPKKTATKTTAKKTVAQLAKPVKVDIWHWKDPMLQPMQLLLRARSVAPTILQAVIHLKNQRVVQLTTKEVPKIRIGNRGNSDIALGIAAEPYLKEMSWDVPGQFDAYLINIVTGKKERFLTKVNTQVSLSPSGKFVIWWDSKKRAWRSMNLKTRKTKNISVKIPYPVHDEQHDHPMPVSAYGIGGWLKNDAAVLIYDRHDIWIVDPNGTFSPRCFTDEYGRKHQLQFRYTRLDSKERDIDPTATIFLKTVHLQTKASGYYRDQLGTKHLPKKMILKNEKISITNKAKHSNDILLTRSAFHKYPNIWQSTTEFNTLHRMSDVNPQQKNYKWGRSELVEWKATDGQKLQGILIKPDNFDPKKKYPMIVYFYERLSDRLHNYISPAPSRATINFSFYASNGYLIFVPDVTYKTGEPGESAVNCILPGIKSLIKKGFVDEKHIGTQGHSWGGYQVAYLVTQTNLFAAAESGAPVSNMTSAYGGIRWGTGMSRMFQYEKTQSRIGNTLWKARRKYIKNSPLFFANRVNTPLLILHNDKDDAVPWYQGIEMFVALRRLSKPAWLINYNNEYHGIRQLANRKDFSIRMQQFFDHYLKDAPAPVWLAKGIPASQKGKTTGFEFVKPEPKKVIPKKLIPKKPIPKKSVPKKTALPKVALKPSMK